MKAIIIVLTVLISFAVAGKKNRQPSAVATSIPALGALSKEILKGTPIKVIEPFGGDISIDEFEGIARDYETELDELAKVAVAVVGIRSIIPSDPLFVQLRHRNIRIVEIDCATPSSPVLSALGKVRRKDGTPNPFVWLSLSNAIRIAEILGSDFSALFPAHSKTVSANLLEFKRNANTLRNEFVRLFLETDDFSAVSLTDDFDYLLKDIDLFVVEDFPAAVIINGWEADSLGIKTAVLKTGLPAEEDEFEEGFLEFWKRNVSAILNAMRERDD